MKIQCSCGAKYEIEVAPGMQPVQFVCANCGLDSSDFVNALIRKELDAPNPPVPAPPPPEPSPRRLRISTTRPASPAESPSPEAEQPESLFCARHQELAVERCVVCKKPICPKCMELFGCVCSPFCKARAVAQKTNVPIYAGQAFLAEARYWKKTGAIFAVVGLMLAGILGAWAWYAWFGSVPRVVFSIPFRNAAYAGGSYLANDQIVILHGGALARYDLKTGQKVWSRQLISAQAISDVAQRENAAAARESAMNPNENTPAELPSVVLQNARAALEGQFTLHASGHDVWTAAANVLTHYDWDTGRTLQKITLTNRYGEWVQQGDELQAIHAAASGAQTIARLDMAGGQLQTETVPGWTGQMPPASAGSPGGGASGGLPVSAGAPARPLNPQTVSRQAQHLTLPARLALPALLANSEHEQQLEQALNGGAPGVPQKPAAPPPSMGFTVIPDGANYVEFSSTLIKPHFVEQEAIQSAPEKSALDNPNLNSSDTSAVANQILNEMQRNSGGDKVVVDESIYQVAIGRFGETTPDWAGLVIGPPRLYPLATVNVLAAGGTITVFNKSNRKLWQAQLIYPVPAVDNGQSSTGAGPCAERDGILYVFDAAVLTAFDPAAGNVLWRLPSIGILGLFFDQGMVYVNTTTANLNNLKYSRQIDVTRKIRSVLLKVDPKTGRIVWTSQPRGAVCYVSGPFIYASYSFDPGDVTGPEAALMGRPFLRLVRIDPGNGHVLWEYTEGRAPVDMQFDGPTIRLIFKKQVEVLHYLVL